MRLAIVHESRGFNKGPILLGTQTLKVQRIIDPSANNSPFRLLCHFASAPAFPVDRNFKFSSSWREVMAS